MSEQERAKKAVALEGPVDGAVEAYFAEAAEHDGWSEIRKRAPAVVASAEPDESES
ncbi:MAG: hypothetical protein K8H88_29505 [Sandaracinaceae bacterium]|nr:hypothetical protein [Sandaracinaceae bacterium]